MMVCFCHHILQNIKKIKSHLLQCMTINRMSNLAFGGHFGFSLSTHLAHVEEMEVLWIMAQEGLLDISRKIQLSLFFF